MAEKSEVRNTMESFEQHNNIILSIDLICHLAILTKDINPPRSLTRSHKTEKNTVERFLFPSQG